MPPAVGDIYSWVQRMCLDRGLQGQGSTRPSPTSLMATPKGKDCQHSQHRPRYHKIIKQRCTEWHKTKFYIPRTACWLSRVKSEPCACDTMSLNLENDLYDKSSSPKSSLSPSNLYYPKSAKKPLSMDGRVVSLQYTALPIMKRSQLSYGTLYHAYQTSVAHFDHWSPLQLPETVFNVLLGTLPKPESL